MSNEQKDQKPEVEQTATPSISEFDAVHPRFVKENPEDVVKYEQEHYYYCEQCRMYFAPTFEALRVHFDKEIITHEPIGSCFYCKGNVFGYKKSGQLRAYHNCPE
ncbi:unnamed protein product [Phyllotreta striolata]|uniref:Uncharacterized protein n=1 Tax=Phyllotreta striolata TaxID=444603 RepID=A0A9N9XP12_PHYSR|nr:unnamed protein product [Phyllotreta striolata]